MRNKLVLQALLLLTAVSLVARTADCVEVEDSDDDDDYCIDDDCDDDVTSVELYKEKSWYSYIKDSVANVAGAFDINKLVTLIVYNFKRKYQELYNSTALLVNTAKTSIVDNLENVYNATAELVHGANEIIMRNLNSSFEQFYKYYENVKNTTREFGQKVYEKAANFTEQVRVVFS